MGGNGSRTGATPCASHYQPPLSNGNGVMKTIRFVVIVRKVGGFFRPWGVCSEPISVAGTSNQKAGGLS